MQGLPNSNAATPALGQPIVVVDAAILSRVAGGLGPHGGWSTPATAPGRQGAPLASGPHGGWRAALLGPHGGW